MVQDGFKMHGKPLNPEQVVVTPELLRHPEFEDREEVTEEVPDAGRERAEVQQLEERESVHVHADAPQTPAKKR